MTRAALLHKNICMEKFEDIRANVESWAKQHLDKEFRFREYQLDIISSIIYRIVNDNTQTQIVEAPTGSGKSILCIVAAGVLAEHYGKTSYILCSDLYLWSQYEAFISKNELPFGALKGQSGNYICEANGLDVKLGACKIERIPWRQLYKREQATKLGFACADSCEYVLARRRAHESKVCLMTYQLWLYQMNVVKSENEKKEFGSRDVLFCDECHNVPEIVSSFSSLVVSPQRDFPHLCGLWKLVQGKIDDNAVADEMLEKLQASFNDLWNAEEDQEVYAAFSKYASYVMSLPTLDTCIDMILNLSKSKRLFKRQMHLLQDADYVCSLRSRIEDFLVSVGDGGIETLAKDNSLSKDGQKSATLSCVKEDYLCSKYLFGNTKHAVMMSATVGQKDAFDENVGIALTRSQNSVMMRVPSTFDFTKSPIYSSNKCSMALKCLAQSFPKVADISFKLMALHREQHGIIQTGSYKLAMQLYEIAPEGCKARMLLYSGNTEKQEMIAKLKSTPGLVLVGPTLLEGIDLPDDLCRFIIMVKVPFPNLGSEATKKKLKLFPKWYEGKASIGILQGIGRGNRHRDDWCVTYILDSCWRRLYAQHKDAYPREFQERVRFI